MPFCEVLAGISILFLVLYHLVSNYDFWKKRGVRGPKPVPLFGNFKDVLLGKTNLGLHLKTYYYEYKSESLIGIYVARSTMLILRDPDIIKDVLIKDFNVFPDRGLFKVEENDIFGDNLFMLEYERWRPLRHKLSPVFSSRKLKGMFYLIVDCANHLEKYVEKLAEKGEPIECRDLMAKYMTDVIGACVFGLNANALSDEESRFRKAGRDLMDDSLKNFLRRLGRNWFPTIFRLLRPFIENDASEFFASTLKKTVEYRKMNNVRRNDFLDLLMELIDEPEKINNFETMRKYPPGSILHRQSAAAYTFAGTNVSIPKNTKILVPVWAIHRDSNIFPNPNAFDPERFNEENEKTRHPMNFLPFGDGPHNCIGIRFASYQMKIGIATLINNFRIDVCDKTCTSYRIDPRLIVPVPIGGIYLKITKL